MGERLKNDWAKVQGRFESLSFVEAPEQTLRIVAAAFSNALTESQRESVRKRATRIANALSRAKALPSGLKVDAAANIFASCYPIHPVTLLALPQLCQRFAQNERTLFSYLGSREPHGFQDSLASLAKIGNWVLPAISTTTSFTTSRRCWLIRSLTGGGQRSSRPSSALRARMAPAMHTTHRNRHR